MFGYTDRKHERFDYYIAKFKDKDIEELEALKDAINLLLEEKNNGKN